MAKKYSNYRNPVIHSFSGTVTCVKNGKDINASAGMRLNGISSVKTGANSKVSIVLDDSAKKGKLCGVTVESNAEINVSSGSSGVTVEIVKGSCAEATAEQDSKIPAGFGNTTMGIRG